MVRFRHLLALVPLLGFSWSAVPAPEAIRVIPNQYVAKMTAAMPGGLFNTTLGLVRDALGPNNQLGYTYNFFDFQGFSFTAPQAVVNLIREIPGIELIHPNYAHHTVQQSDGQISFYDSTGYALDRISHRRNANSARRSPPTFISNLPSGKYITIYIIDSGIRTSHGDFGGRASKGRNFAPDNVLAGHAPRAFEDYIGHGTSVAGLAGGTLYGVAYNSFLVDVRIFNDNGSTTYADEVAAIDWAANDAISHDQIPTSVLNLSFGGVDTRDADILRYAVQSAVRNGLFLTVAAGNNRMDVADFTPANVLEACTIGGTDANDREYYYSNYGRFIDLWAPGSGIIAPSNSSNIATKEVYGTSFAAPLVAGVAAVFKSYGINFYNRYPPERLCTFLQQIGTKNVLDLSSFPNDSPGPNVLLYNNSTM